MKSAAFAVLFALGAAAAQAGPIYTFEILDVPGARHTLPEGLNDAGVIVGYSIDAAGKAQALIRDATGYSIFKVFDTFNASPFDINNAGQITGFYITDDPVVFWSGFVKSGDVNSVFDVPSAFCNDPAWTFEQKLDGIRVLPYKNGERVDLVAIWQLSVRPNPTTGGHPDGVAPLLGEPCVIDDERRDRGHLAIEGLRQSGGAEKT